MPTDQVGLLRVSTVVPVLDRPCPDEHAVQGQQSDSSVTIRLKIA